MGTKNIWSIDYGGDIVLMFTKEERLRSMIEGLRKYFMKKVTNECWDKYNHGGLKNKIKGKEREWIWEEE